MNDAVENQAKDTAEQVVTEPSRVKKSKYINMLVGGALAVAILGGGYYISQKTKASYKSYKIKAPYTAQEAKPPYGVYEASSVENDGDGEFKYTYNKLAIAYEVSKKDYSIFEDCLKDSSMDKSLSRLQPSDAEDIWKRVNVRVKDEGNKFKEEYSEKYKEYTNKHAYYKESGHTPFCATKGFYDRNNILTNLDFKVIPTKVGNDETYGDYFKDKLLVPLKKKLDSMKEKLDMLHDRIDKHY